MPRQGDDVVFSGLKLAEMPLGNDGLGLRHAFDENVDGHDDAKIAHANSHLSVSDFVSWRFVHKRRQVVLPRHTVHPSLNTERFGIRPKVHTERNPVNDLATFVIDERLAAAA